MVRCLLCAVLLACTLTVAAQSDTAKIGSVSINDIDTTKFAKVEKEAEFPGGAQGWQKFLEQHLTYPPKAVRKNIQGTVVLQFIIAKDGTVTNLEAISGPDILREAAIEVLKKSPKWIPAVQGGRPVKAYKKQPIVFHFSK